MLEERAMDRRQFVSAGLMGAAALGAAGLLGGCGAQQQPAPVDEADAEAEDAASAVGWRGSEPDISDSEIKETIEVEIAIVGGGVAGLAAGLGALDNGAKSIAVLESLETSRIAGGVHAAVNTKLQNQVGITFSPEQIDEMIKSEIRNSSGYADERMYRVWANESGAVIDRLVELIAENGFESKINTYPLASYKQKDYEYYTEGEFPVGHNLGPGDDNSPCIQGETAILQKAGAQFLYSTQGLKLVKNDAGDIAGVIGAKQDGSYVLVKASKGVVVATGSFGHNADMVEALCPQIRDLELPCLNPNTTDDGSGIKMMLWAGACMQAGPVAVMTKCKYQVPQPVPFLIVDSRGERFHNEATSNFAEFNYVINQPGMTAWQIFDSKWVEACDKMQVMTWTNTYSVNAEKKEKVEGKCLKADTIEELAGLMGVPADALKATVERRNALADSGHDDDFGVPIDRLTATKIVDAPFFANQSNEGALPGYAVTLGGVWVNARMQVVDAQGDAIKGLFSAGNCAGRRFGSAYFQEICGLSNGFAATHGYIAGREAARA